MAGPSCMCRHSPQREEPAEFAAVVNTYFGSTNKSSTSGSMSKEEYTGKYEIIKID